MNRRSSAWFYIFLIFNNDVVLSAYHWRISEDGKKIEAVVDSPYQLLQPGSLTDFLKQVDNVRTVSSQMKELKQVVDKISMHEQLDNPEFEKEFRQKEESCIKSRGAKLESETFHTSFSAELCPEFHAAYQGYTDFVKEYFGSPPDSEHRRPPRCNYWFKAVKINAGNNVDLSRVAIPDIKGPIDELYVQVLEMYFPAFAKLSKESEGLTKYGHMLSSMLSHSDDRISRNVYLHMAAAAYWRAQGQLLDAYNCYHTGAQFIDSSKSQQFEPHNSRSEAALKLALGTLLNRSGFSAEGYHILRQLSEVEDNPSCFRGMIYAASGDSSVLSDAISFDEKAKPSEVRKVKLHYQLKLTNTERMGVFSRTFSNYAHAAHYFKEAQEQLKQKDGELLDTFFYLCESKAYTLSCHIRLHDELEKQHANLDKLMTESDNFQTVYNRRVAMNAQIHSLLAPKEVRYMQKLFYDLVKYGPHPNRKCKPGVVNRFPSSEHRINMAVRMNCRLTISEEAYQKSMAPLREATKKRPLMNETVWKVTEVFTKNRSFERGLMEVERNSQTEGYFRLIPAKYSDNELDPNEERTWRRVDWPNSVDCQAVVSSSNPFRRETFPQIFISPENRGWIISELLTTHLTLGPNDNLPLPWYEPRCDDYDRNRLSLFTRFEGVERLLNPRLDRRNEKYAESTLKTTFVRLAERVLDDHEVAARIHLLLKYNIGPKWVSLNLAGLYWRIHGNPHQAAKCLLGAFLEKPEESFISIVQLTQVILKVTKRANYAQDFLIHQLSSMAYKEPMFHYVHGRLSLLMHHVDQAIQHLKDALDRAPDDQVIAEDLLKIACSGKSTKPAISLQFPTVCCSSLVQNAVCIKPKKDADEQCYVVDDSNPDVTTHRLIYHRCNGLYDGSSKKTSDFANIVSPFLLIFNTVARRDDVSNWVKQVDGIQTVDSDELPLDYGGSDSFFIERPAEWWDSAKNEMRYLLPTKEESSDEWEENYESDLADIPSKPLSFLWIREKARMIDFDAKLPSILPTPSFRQIRKGVAVFPPPRTATMSCNGIQKLDVLFDNPPSTWVSVTAKGEDIEKYVDLRGPMPAMASLQPICPSIDKFENSPILGLDHIPAFSLSDQFLFYKPEKALAEALKSLGNEKDTIERVAARLHSAMLHHQAKDGTVHWLLCVLSSLYWRVTGDAENAMVCLRCALNTAPPNMRDVALVSLANVCHQAGLLNSALIAAGAALSTSPRLVAIHFTLANIYASMGDYNQALNFYYSTLALQSNFQPAKDRIRAIYCHSGHEFDF